MNAIFVANWPMLLAFAGGALMGILVGWLLRSWREPDAHQDAEAPAKVRPTRGSDASDIGRRQDPARIPAASPAQEAGRRLEPWGDENGPAILLIDDRLEMLGIHAAYLRKHGYRTLMAETGTAGLAFARAYLPALIVLDHSMPDRTGVEVARELKADPATAAIPILLMTAMSYGAVGAAAMEAGCAAYLSKPIEPSRLLREIEARAPRGH